MCTPAGVCIQALADMIQSADSEAPVATITVANRWMPGATRRQPNIMMPIKPASSMNAIAASNPRMLPMKSPVTTANSDQLVPNWNSSGMPLTTPMPKFSSSSLLQNRAWW